LQGLAVREWRDRAWGRNCRVALAVAYAVKYPGKVSHLVLHGGYKPETMFLN